MPAAWHGATVALGGLRVTGVVPGRGVTTGDQVVTITGSGFVAGQTAVWFGIEPARAVTVTSPTALTAVTPRHGPEVVDVLVEAAGAFGVLPVGFRYEPPAAEDGPDLRLTKTHAGTFAVGVPGVYTLTVTNVGADATTGDVVMVDTLPPGLGYLSSSGTGWTCVVEGVYVGCRHAGPLPPRASLPPLQLTVSVGAAAAPSVTNKARTWTAGERRDWDNHATDVTAVVAPPTPPGSQKAANTATEGLIDNLSRFGDGARPRAALQVGASRRGPPPGGPPDAARPTRFPSCDLQGWRTDCRGAHHQVWALYSR